MRQLILVILFAIIWIVQPLPCQAQIPRTLSYQGLLTDTITGEPRPDGDYQFTFSLYDTSTGSTPIWIEKKTLPVKGGLFSTMLGNVAPFGSSVKFDKQYWLGIRVGNEAELMPRISLASVGYSLTSIYSDTAKYSLNGGSSRESWITKDDTIYTLKETVGIGTENPKGQFHVSANHLILDNAGTNFIIFGASDNIEHNHYLELINSTQYSSAWGLKTGGVLISDTYRYANPGKNDLIVKGRIGIGIKNPSATLDIGGGPSWTSVNWKKALKFENANAIEFDIASNLKFGIGASSSGKSLYFFTTTSEGTNAPPKYFMSANENGLSVNGRTKTKVLEIIGGSDLAEPFEISNAVKLPEGSLAVIDPEQPGKLKQATEPYDKRVAGVISGAGGINPGLTLSQDGLTENGQHVALTGKVYALATTSNGPIEPGDLLTTSHIPGHAMKATDILQSHGAVIGKAMSNLEEGEGLVLVLINLQ